MRRAAGLFVVAVFLHALTGSAYAVETFFGFENITSNNLTDAEIGEMQLIFSVMSVAPDQVAFTFFNNGPEPSTIADIYFDDALGELSHILGIDNDDPGVSFSTGSHPPVLPGGNTVSLFV